MCTKVSAKSLRYKPKCQRRALYRTSKSGRRPHARTPTMSTIPQWHFAPLRMRKITWWKKRFWHSAHFCNVESGAQFNSVTKILTIILKNIHNINGAALVCLQHCNVLPVLIRIGSNHSTRRSLLSQDRAISSAGKTPFAVGGTRDGRTEKGL